MPLLPLPSGAVHIAHKGRYTRAIHSVVFEGRQLEGMAREDGHRYPCQLVNNTLRCAREHAWSSEPSAGLRAGSTTLQLSASSSSTVCWRMLSL